MAAVEPINKKRKCCTTVSSSPPCKRRSINLPLSLLDLPFELIVHIISKLPEEDHLWLALANKYIYAIFHDLVPLQHSRLYAGRACINTPARLTHALTYAPPSSRFLYKAFKEAVMDNNMVVMQSIYAHLPSLYQRKIRTNINLVDTASENGDLPILQWLRAIGCNFTTQSCTAAARGGHLHIIQWLRKKGCPWHRLTCAMAAYGGHLDVLQWARKKGCPWGVTTCAYAAYRGHFEVLQWARENQCPWDETVCSHAAEGGHLEVLQWLREEGCPWDEWTCVNAAEGEHFAVLQWAVANGCKYEKKTLLRLCDNQHIRAWIEAQPE